MYWYIKSIINQSIGLLIRGRVSNMPTSQFCKQNETVPTVPCSKEEQAIVTKVRLVHNVIFEDIGARIVCSI